MFTAPLTADEYRILLDAKYSSGAEQIKGWALRDKDGRTRGWHIYESGSSNWAHAQDALRAFVPYAKDRRKLTLLGWEIVATRGLQDLTALLQATRGDNIDTAEITQP